MYRSPYSYSGAVRSLQLGQSRLLDQGFIKVLGLEMQVGMTSCQFLQPLLTYARNKFWSLKHLLHRRTPAAGCTKLMDRVVTNSIMWCLGAIPADKHALGLVNSTQAMLMGWMLRHAKASGESWVDYRRSQEEIYQGKYRCSVQVELHGWSTVWLTRWRG